MCEPEDGDDEDAALQVAVRKVSVDSERVVADSIVDMSDEGLNQSTVVCGVVGSCKGEQVKRAGSLGSSTAIVLANGQKLLWWDIDGDDVVRTASFTLAGDGKGTKGDSVFSALPALKQPAFVLSGGHNGRCMIAGLPVGRGKGAFYWCPLDGNDLTLGAPSEPSSDVEGPMNRAEPDSIASTVVASVQGFQDATMNHVGDEHVVATGAHGSKAAGPVSDDDQDDDDEDDSELVRKVRGRGPAGEEDATVPERDHDASGRASQVPSQGHVSSGDDAVIGSDATHRTPSQEGRPLVSEVGDELAMEVAATREKVRDVRLVDELEDEDALGGGVDVHESGRARGGMQVGAGSFLDPGRMILPLLTNRQASLCGPFSLGSTYNATRLRELLENEREGPWDGMSGEVSCVSSCSCAMGGTQCTLVLPGKTRMLLLVGERRV